MVMDFGSGVRRSEYTDRRVHIENGDFLSAEAVDRYPLQRHAKFLSCEWIT